MRGNLYCMCVVQFAVKQAHCYESTCISALIKIILAVILLLLLVRGCPSRINCRGWARVFLTKFRAQKNQVYKLPQILPKFSKPDNLKILVSALCWLLM